MLVGDGRDDARHELVLKGEDSVWPERAIEGLGPEVDAVQRIHELHGQPQLDPASRRLPSIT